MNRSLLLVPALALAFPAGGCRLDPAHHRPDPGTPAAWRDGRPDTASLANVAWFDLYQDPVLRSLLTASLDGNHDLKAATQRIEEARALAAAAGADVYPRLDLSASSGAYRSSRKGFPEIPGSDDVTSGLHRLSFDLSWEIDVFGRIRNQTAAETARWMATVEAQRAITITLLADVARAYFELRSLDARVEISTRTLKSRREYVDLARIRFEGGKTSEIDFRQSEGEAYRTEVLLLDFLRQAEQKENQIAVLVGRSPHAILRGRAAAHQPTPAAVPTGLPSDLVSRRPDLLAAEDLLMAETKLVGVARANLYPRFALTGSYGWESADLSNMLTSPASAANLVAGFLQPIFNAGRNRRLAEAQCARMKAAAEDYAQAVLRAFGEVDDGLVAYRRAGESRVLAAKRTGALRKVLELAEIRYKGSVAAYLEVLDSQRELLNGELEEADVVEAQLVALTALYKALGGGWNAEQGGGRGAATALAGTERPTAPGASRVAPAPAAFPSAAAPMTTASPAPSPAPAGRAASAATLAPTAPAAPSERAAPPLPLAPATPAIPAAPPPPAEPAAPAAGTSPVAPK